MNELLLLSGNDIPFYTAKVNIRQPKIKDIALIGEENFFVGCHLLNFSKDLLKEEDKVSLSDLHDFDILMSILHEQQAEISRLNVLMLLTLMFPDHKVQINPQKGIILTKENEESIINKENYEEFRNFIREMYRLDKLKGDDYKPANKRAEEIMEKMRKGREKVAAAKGETGAGSIFSRYISILAVGLNMEIQSLLENTVYQIYNLFDRFNAYQNFDINLRARMAGAEGLDDAPNWMGDLKSIK